MPDRSKNTQDTPKPLIFDPEQVAVALQHEKGTSKAPKITASGRGAVAEQILQLAFANGVKVRQDADLVEILASIDVDTEIPLEAFAAVAEILSFVYRANGEAPPEPGSFMTSEEPEKAEKNE